MRKYQSEKIILKNNVFLLSTRVSLRCVFKKDVFLLSMVSLSTSYRAADEKIMSEKISE